MPFSCACIMSCRSLILVILTSFNRQNCELNLNNDMQGKGCSLPSKSCTFSSLIYVYETNHFVEFGVGVYPTSALLVDKISV